MRDSFDVIYNTSVKANISAGRVVSIFEHDTAAKLKQLNFKLLRRHILNGSAIRNSIFIELDKNSSPYGQISYFFNSHAPDINKRSDLVIYHEKDEYLAILICDLKSSARGSIDDRAKKQFLNSMKFLDYVTELSNTYFNFTKPVRFFYVSFCPKPPIPSSALLGAPVTSQQLLQDHSVGINSELVTIDANGVGEIHWEELLARIP